MCVPGNVCITGAVQLKMKIYFAMKQTYHIPMPEPNTQQEL